MCSSRGQLLLAAKLGKIAAVLLASKERGTAHLILLFFICSPFVGLTWIFGYLALIQVTSLVFQYLFCIFNSFQGLLIFIFHNIREPAVQKEWRKLCSCLIKEKSVTSSTGMKNTDNTTPHAVRKYDNIQLVNSNHKTPDNTSTSMLSSTEN